jgi:hypothetical protein
LFLSVKKSLAPVPGFFDPAAERGEYRLDATSRPGPLRKPAPALFVEPRRSDPGSSDPGSILTPAEGTNSVF